MSRYLGSPGSRQLLQLQLFPKFKKKFGTSFWFYLSWICFGFLNSIVILLQVWILWGWIEVDCFPSFRKLNDYFFVCQCFWLWTLKFDLKMMSFWYEWFPSLLLEFYLCLNKKFSSLCCRYFKAETKFSITSQLKVFWKLNKWDKTHRWKTWLPSECSLVSFCNCSCIENYGPDSLFNRLPTVKKENVYKSKLKVPKSKALARQRHF